MLALVGSGEYLPPIAPVDRELRIMHRKASNTLTVLGIEGNTALVQTGDGYEVLGSGGVTVWNQAGQTRHTDGPLPSWLGVL